MLFAYKSILFRFSLNNETIMLKKYLEYAQNYSLNKQEKIVVEFNKDYFAIKAVDGTFIKKHPLPRKISINGKNVIFTKNLTPSKGQTIIVNLGKKQKTITIDPSTGRIKIYK